jgi:predicted glycoside hydrolase/deacetylase ChbG (UPF0249 family)
MKQLIVHADDLGLCDAFNEGIRLAATEGFLTSTCLRTNGTAYAAALREVLPALPRLGVGVHLNIVEGQSRLRDRPKGSDLYDADGYYRYGFAQLIRLARRRSVLRDIEADFRDQIETVLRDRRIDHLNGHQHCHAIPAVFDVVCRLAREYDVPFIRVPAERPAIARGHYPWLGIALNFVKVAVLSSFTARLRRIAAEHGRRTNAAFVGLLYSGYMDEAAIHASLERAADAPGPVEVLLHPCANAGRTRELYWPRIRDYAMSKYRARELRALTSPRLEERIRRAGWTLTNYSELSSLAPGPAAGTAPLRCRTSLVRRLRVVAILDETPFYQPVYLRRLIEESNHADIVAVARVVARGGGIVPRYMLRNWHQLGLREFTLLGVKHARLRLAGFLPAAVRGGHEGAVGRVVARFDIPTRTISTVRTDEFHLWVASFEPDVILSSNSLIFPDSLLRVPRLAAINRHTALLPSYGGILPAFRAVQKGEDAIGVSVHLMTSRIDEGPVIARRRIPIEPGDTLDRLYRLAFDVSVDATEEAFAQIRAHDGPPPPLPNEEIVPSYYSFPTPADWAEFRARGGRFI